MDETVASVGPSAASGTRPERAVILDRVRSCVETVSREFDQWTDPHAQGPGLYFVIESDPATGFTEPMGANRWPVEECASVLASPEALFDAATAVAYACDGAVVVHPDATIQAAMVRMRQVATSDADRLDDLPYAGWMGARHMSALETSTRPEIFAALTLSEEDGRVTVFRDGTFEDHPRGDCRDELQGSD